MFYLLFLLGFFWQIDDGIIIESDLTDSNTNNIVSLIRNYSEAELLIYINDPALDTILTEFFSSDLSPSIIDHIRARMEELERDRTIIFTNRLTYGGVIERDDDYKPPLGIGSDELTMMFYTDPNFTKLIGDYELSEDQVSFLTDVVEANILS
jgi:hypothetical protein